MGFQLDPDVPCDAIVDRRDMLTGGGRWWFEVTVSTAPFLRRRLTRTYFVEAFSDSAAAQEAIGRFVAEYRQIRAARRTILLPDGTPATVH